MTDDQVSRAAIAAYLPTESQLFPSDVSKAPANLLEVKRRIKTMTLKPAKLRDDIVSALHTIARAVLPPELKKPSQEQIDAALARISVHARHLTPLFDRRVGARLGYTRAGWRNIPSLVKKGLRRTGAWSLFKQERIPLAGDWQVVADKSPRLSYIRLLGHWGMLMGVEPLDLGDTHPPQFLEWLLTWKARTYALKCYFAALGDWNKGAARHPDWPGQAVTVVTRLTDHYSVRREKWPHELRADVRRIIETLRHPDPDEESPYEPIAEYTAHGYEVRLYLLLSAYVAASKLEPSSIRSVDVILDPAAAKIALDYQLRWTQRTKPEVTRTSHVHGSAKLLATIADRCYRQHIPAEAILRLQKMARARSPIRKGMAPKNRELLKRFDDETLLARFLAKPYEVCAEILKRGRLRRVDEVRLMLAFAVAQSIEAPLRPEDQAALIDGEHVFKVRTGKVETLAIRLTSQKTKVDLDFELSGEIVDFYDTYTQVGRKKLCAPENRHLYPGPGNGPKARGSLNQQITRFIEDELGIRVTCQQFRHVIGYVYLRSHPGDYETVRQLLGHTDITTTMAFYASMDMRAASKKVSAFVAQRRQELVPLLRKRDRNKE